MPRKPLQQNGISPPSYRLASRAICSEYGSFHCILAGTRLSLGPAEASPGPKKRFGQMAQIRYQQLFSCPFVRSLPNTEKAGIDEIPSGVHGG
ncbi:MAG: hypothetical protein DWH82_09000 [Planctomycetota bacterium]|nr:MAG: hypothetical protein DWH82_09000 [Planctomycetota bacterium]